MARARNIKPSFFDNDELAEIEPIGRLFFIGLWTVVDFKGEVEWRAKKIKAQVLPYDNCDVENIAINLDKYGFIRFYSVQGKTYLKVVNFERHQNPHKNEKLKGSDVPRFSEEAAQAIDFKDVTINLDKSRLNQDKDGTDRADSCSLIPDSLNLIPEPLVNKDLYQSATDQEVYDFCFNQFWTSGMNKVGKKAAKSLFFKVVKKHSKANGETAYDFTNKLSEDIQLRLQAQQMGFAEMHPTTYLNGERWTDEIKEARYDQGRQFNQQNKLSTCERTSLENRAAYDDNQRQIAELEAELSDAEALGGSND